MPETYQKSSSSDLLAVLKEPAFLTYSISVIFTQIAYNMMNIVLIFLIFRLTSSTLAISLLLLAFLLPQIFFSFLGGIIADAKNKRKILLIGNILRAVSVLAMFFWHSTIPVVYLLVLVISIATQLYVPAESPLIPHLVKKNLLLAANAIFGICLFGSILIGYVIAGPAINFFGSSGVFLFIATLFLLAALCIFVTPNVAPATRKLRIKNDMLGNVLHLYKLVISEFDQSVNVIREKPNVAISFLFLALSQVIVFLLATLVPGYAKTTLHILPEDISLYIFAPAAFGMIISSILIGSIFHNWNKQKIMSFGIFLSSFSMFALAVVGFQSIINPLFGTIGIAFLAGVANSFIFVPTQTVIQTEVADEFRAKIYGLLFVAVGIIALIPILLAGVFADVLGTKVVLIGISGLLFGIGITKNFLFPALKRRKIAV